MWPSVELYLSLLPDGLDSYPDATTKYAVVRQFFELKQISRVAPELPREVAELLEHPRPRSAWVPEVHASVAYLGLRECCFSSDQAFVDYAYERNRALLKSWMYRALLRLLSAPRVVDGAPRAWKQLHSGSSLTVTRGPAGAEIRLEFPDALFPQVVARALATAFLAAFEGAGAEGVASTLTRWGRREAMYVVTWDT